MKKKTNSIDFCKETIERKGALEMGWIDLAARLKEVRDGELYKGHWDSFEDFLNDPQMDMDKGTASKMITIHERLIVDLKIPKQSIVDAGGWSKLSEAMPVINTVEDAIEWIEKASVLSKDDLRKEVNTKRGKDAKVASCKHTDTYTIAVCRDCGLKVEDHK